MVTTRLMTAEELEQLPDDGYRYELVRGEPIRMSPTSPRHFRVTGHVHGSLYAFVTERDLGVVGPEGGFVLERDPDTVLAPDVAFVRKDRWPQGDDELHFGQLAPDLAVEVRSPSESRRRFLAKGEIYLAAGTRLVWLVDPDDSTVLVLRVDGSRELLREGDELDGEDVLPGFRLALSRIFRRP